MALPVTAEDYPEGQILGDPRATKVILQFLSNTAIGVPRGEDQALNRAHADNKWGLEALEEAEQAGEVERAGEG